MGRIGLGAALVAGMMAATAGSARAADWGGYPGYHVRHHYGHYHRHSFHRHHRWVHAYGAPVFLSCSDRPGPFASPVRPVDCDEAYVARGIVYNAPLPPVVRGVYASEVVRARY